MQPSGEKTCNFVVRPHQTHNPGGAATESTLEDFNHYVGEENNVSFMLSFTYMYITAHVTIGQKKDTQGIPPVEKWKWN